VDYLTSSLLDYAIAGFGVNSISLEFVDICEAKHLSAPVNNQLPAARVF
jgi:hypothetical protein